MKIETIEQIKITAEDGKVLRRILDNQICGNVVYLGYTYYLGGAKLAQPIKEVPEFYEEIDAPIEKEK
ncbi:MAG: hypothetical protein PHI48_06640 [Bacteroidales bacterium]|nr:hypothetical protein [Bacteroidales bacterium]